MESIKTDDLISNRIKDFTILAMRSFFSNDPEFTWEASENDTKIIISDKYAINLEAVEKKPAISVQRGVIRWAGRHLNKFLGSDFRTKDHFIDRAICDIIILCLSRVGLEAETMGQKVWHMFTIFDNELREKGVYNVNAVALGEERVAKSNSDIDISIVPVTINIEIVDNWTVVQSTPEV